MKMENELENSKENSETKTEQTTDTSALEAELKAVNAERDKLKQSVTNASADASEWKKKYNSKLSEEEQAKEQQETDITNETGMTSLFASSLSDELLSLDVMAMTPIEAMNELYKLQQKAQKEAGRA